MGAQRAWTCSLLHILGNMHQCTSLLPLLLPLPPLPRFVHHHFSLSTSTGVPFQKKFFSRRSTFAGFIHSLRHNLGAKHSLIPHRGCKGGSFNLFIEISLNFSSQSLSWIIVPSEEPDCQDLRKAEAIFLLKSFSAKVTPSPMIVRSFCPSVFLSVSVFPSVCIVLSNCVLALLSPNLRLFCLTDPPG